MAILGKIWVVIIGTEGEKWKRKKKPILTCEELLHDLTFQEGVKTHRGRLCQRLGFRPLLCMPFVGQEPQEHQRASCCTLRIWKGNLLCSCCTLATRASFSSSDFFS